MERKKGAILSYVLMVFEVLSTLLITPFLIRTLGQAEYGVYKLSASITAYLLLLDLGVGNAIVRYIAKYRVTNDKESEKKFLAIAMAFYGGIALVAIIAGVILIALFPTVFSKGLSPEEIILGQKLLLITVINVAITIGTTVYANVIVAYERFTISKGVPVIQIIIRMIITVIVLKQGMGSMGIVSLNLLMTVLSRGFFVIYVFGKLKLRPQFKGIQFSFIKDILVYSSWILVQMVATQINASLDPILLGAFVAGATEVIAVYSVGVQLVQYFQSIGGAFSSILMPGVVKLVQHNSSGEAICNEMVRIGRIVLMIIGLVWGGFVVFGRQFIELWAGTENAKAYYVAILLMTIYVFILTEAIGTQILWAKNEHKEQSLLKLAVVLINVVLTIALIKWNPLFGATIGTGISLLVGDVVVMNLVFARKLKISLAQYYRGLFKGILPCILITVGAGLAINLLPVAGWGGLILKIVPVCLIYSIAIWLIGTNLYEKKLLGNLLRMKK